MEVTIFGASGLVGSSVLSKLLDNEKVSKVYSLGRREIEYSDPKLEQVVLEPFEPDNIVNLELKTEAVVCCLGTTIKAAGSKEAFRFVDYDLCLASAEYAKQHNAKFSIVTATGASSSSVIFYNKIKGQLEDSLKNLGLKSLFIFRPSLLIGERKETRLAEGIEIAVYHALKYILPEAIKLKMGTEVSTLSCKMIRELIENQYELKIFEASQIK